MRLNLFHYLELQSVIANLGLDKSLHFEFAKPCVLQMEQDFWSFSSVGNSAELAVTARGLSNRGCSTNTCSLNVTSFFTFMVSKT